MKLGVWTCDKMRGGGGLFHIQGYQKGGSARFVYAHHTTKAHGTRLNLHALSLKKSQIEMQIANVSDTNGLKPDRTIGYAVRVGLVIWSVWENHRVKKIACCLPSSSLQS